MKEARPVSFRILLFAWLALVLTAAAVPAQNAVPAPSMVDRENQPGQQLDLDVLDQFLVLCDVAAEALKAEPVPESEMKTRAVLRRHVQFFIDSYAVRALAVAYDLTGRQRYLDACRTWTGRMLRYQAGMVPGGAYYMGYHRKPGESEGQWFVADCGSIVMGVLATALRTKDQSERERYLESARSYAGLVMQNFVRDSGGITDGIWNRSDKEWWCSTALFAAFAFQMYGITGEQAFKDVAVKAVNWLLAFQYDQTILYKFEQGAPTTIFYTLEAYCAGLPYLEPGSRVQQEVFARFSQVAEWIVGNQNAEGTWDYNPDNWGVKLGGLPCQLMIYLNHVQDSPARQRKLISSSGGPVTFESLVAGSIDLALRYFTRKGPQGQAFTQQGAFTMMSFAERLCPDQLYAKTGSAFPCRRYSEQELSRIRRNRQAREEK